MVENLKSAAESLKIRLGVAKNPYLLFNADQGSTVCTYLARKYSPRNVPVLFIDTKQNFEEVYLYLQKLSKLWGLSIVQKSFIDVQHEMPEKPSRSECCWFRKASVLERAQKDLRIDLLITGTDSTTLQSDWNCQLTMNQNGCTVINPIANLSDDEIFGAVTELNLPRCSLWTLGLYRIDCKPCSELKETISETNDSRSDKLEIMRRLKSLGYS